MAAGGAVSAQSSSTPNQRYAEIAIDAKTGRVLSEQDSRKKLYPASTTKIMTAYLTFQALASGKIKRTDKILISKYAASMQRTNLRLRSGTYITVDQALRGLMVHSANDAAVVLAQKVGGTNSNFVARMNNTAKRLGMNSTTFRNPNGLPDDLQKTTVADMALLMQAVLNDYPDLYKEYFGLNKFTYKGQTYTNYNTLLEDYVDKYGVRKNGYPGVDGGKTGYIRASGFNLVCSAERDSMRVIAVVFGSVNSSARAIAAEKLLDGAFCQLDSSFCKNDTLTLAPEKPDTAVLAPLVIPMRNMPPYAAPRDSLVFMPAILKDSACDEQPVVIPFRRQDPLRPRPSKQY